MNLLHVTIEGFRSFKQPVEYTVPRSRGLFLVRGENEVAPRLGANGAGKSSFFDSICWAFYGRTARGVGGPAVTTWGQKQTRVLVRFEIDGDQHTIERTRGPNSLKVDGNEVEQARVDDVLGIDYDRFLHAVLLGQFGSMFCDLRPAQRLELFTSVLGLEVWADASKNASKDIAQLRTELATAREEAAAASARYDVLREQRVAEEQSAGTCTSGSRWFPDNELRLVAAKEELKLVDAKYDDCTRSLANWERQIDGDRLRLAERGLDRARADLRDLRARAKRTAAGRCGECGQALPAEHAKHAAVDLRAAHKAFKNARKWHASVAAEHEQAHERVVAMRKKAERLTARHNELDCLIGELLEQKRRHEEATKAEQRMAQLRAEERHAGLWVTAKEAVVGDIEQALATTEPWVARFRELRLWAIDEALAELSIACNSALVALGLVGWTIAFRVERETARGTVSRGFEVLVQAPGATGSVPWEAWCGGETQRLRVACAAGLAELVHRRMPAAPAWEAWDEPTAHLSQGGVDDLVAFFADRARNRQVWLIDHRSLDSGAFDAVVTVRRTKRGSLLA